MNRRQFAITLSALPFGVGAFLERTIAGPPTLEAPELYDERLRWRDEEGAHFGLDHIARFYGNAGVLFIIHEAGFMQRPDEVRSFYWLEEYSPQALVDRFQTSANLKKYLKERLEWFQEEYYKAKPKGFQGWTHMTHLDNYHPETLYVQAPKKDTIKRLYSK